MNGSSRRRKAPNQALTSAVNAVARTLRGAPLESATSALRDECQRLGVFEPDERWIETTARTISRGY